MHSEPLVEASREGSWGDVPLRAEPVRSQENNLYRRYSRRSAEAVAKHGGKVVALGTLEEALQSYPGTEARTVMILVEWSSQESFRAFLDDPELKDLRLLREGGTRNYLWWIYERLEDLRSLFQTQLESDPF